MKKLAILMPVLLLPALAFAQTGDLTTLENMAQSIRTIVNILIPVVFGIGILVFFWGLVKYLFGNDHDKDQAKKTMLWGVIAVFIMAAIWGLVTFIGDTFGINTDENAADADDLNPLD